MFSEICPNATASIKVSGEKMFWENLSTSSQQFQFPTAMLAYVDTVYAQAGFSHNLDGFWWG